MTVASGKQFPVGLKYAAIFELNSNGRPAATGTTAYEGVEVEGEKAFSLTIPDPRKIVHSGQDRVLAVDYLPATEAAEGELRVSVEDQAVLALITDVLSYSVGEAKFVPIGTDRQGEEPQVGMMLYQQALDAAGKQRHWRCFIIASARCIPIVAGMGENAEDTRFKVAPSPTTKTLWGETLDADTAGASEATILIGMTKGRPKLVAFKANGSATDFSFPASAPARDVATISVWKNGTLVSSGLTPAVDKITFSVAPTSGDDIVVLYEL